MNIKLLNIEFSHHKHELKLQVLNLFLVIDELLVGCGEPITIDALLRGGWRAFEQSGSLQTFQTRKPTFAFRPICGHQGSDAPLVVLEPLRRMVFLPEDAETAFRDVDADGTFVIYASPLLVMRGVNTRIRSGLW